MEDITCRWELINALANWQGYQHYLEIGSGTGTCLHQVIIPYKISVDPAYPEVAQYGMTSDRFFEWKRQHPGGPLYDLVFIDGYHEHHQVLQDIKNSLVFLSVGGSILLHDCNPQEECDQSTPPEIHGDVWKAILDCRQRPDLSVWTVNIDTGMGFIQRGTQKVFVPPVGVDIYCWEFLQQHRQEILNLIYPEELWVRLGRYHPEWIDL